MSAVPQPPASVNPAAFDEYMAKVTAVFGDELYQVHQSDAHPEMTAALADCVEAGLLVWGDPLALPSQVA